MGQGCLETRFLNGKGLGFLVCLLLAGNDTVLGDGVGGGPKGHQGWLATQAIFHTDSFQG